MTRSCCSFVLACLLALASLGCGCASTGSPTGPLQRKIDMALARLSPEDQRLAREQVYCAVQDEVKLGSMGVPVRIELEGEPVFLCCQGCLRAAQASPRETLTRVREPGEKTENAEGTPAK